MISECTIMMKNSNYVVVSWKYNLKLVNTICSNLNNSINILKLIIDASNQLNKENNDCDGVCISDLNCIYIFTV